MFAPSSVSLNEKKWRKMCSLASQSNNLHIFKVGTQEVATSLKSSLRPLKRYSKSSQIQTCFSKDCFKLPHTGFFNFFGGSFVASILTCSCSSKILPDRFLSRRRAWVEHLTYSNKRLLHFSDSLWVAMVEDGTTSGATGDYPNWDSQMADISFLLKGYTCWYSVLCYCQANVTLSHRQGLKWDLAGGARGKEWLRNKSHNNLFCELQYIFCVHTATGWFVLLLWHSMSFEDLASWIQQAIRRYYTSYMPTHYEVGIKGGIL